MKKNLAITTTRKSPWKKNLTLRPAADGAPDLVVTDRIEQQWLGFGGCFNELGWRALGHLSADTREAVLKDLFSPDGCNCNFCRMPIGANDYSGQWYSLNEHENDFSMKHFSIERDKEQLIPYIKAAQKYRKGDLILFASPWSPPTWMKYPRAYSHGTFIMEDKFLKAYALYFLRFVQEYAKEGIRIDQVHVQNEPVSSQKFPSCIWTGEQFRVFIRDYLGPLFKKNRITTEIWLGTLNGPETDGRMLTTRYNNYANLVLDDDAARQYVKGVSYQWAGKGAVQRTHAAWPDMALIQSENECGDGNNTWQYATYIFDLFYHYITNNVNGYVYWNMVLEPGGESTWGWRQNALLTVDPATKKVTRNPEYWLMRHFSSFVNRGARRVALERRWAGNAVAFNDQGRIIIVIHNPFDTKRTVTIGSKAGAYQVTLDADSFSTVVLG